MINTIILSGSLADDAAMGYTPEGVLVTSFTLVVRSVDRIGAKERKIVNFLPISTQGKLADMCDQRLRKDMEVFVVGMLEVQSYKGHSNYKHLVVRVLAREVYLEDGTQLLADDDEMTSLF